jgi:hypothetical protein
MPRICAECQVSALELIVARDGDELCPECVAAYYVACRECRGLVPRDTTTDRDGLPYCDRCFPRLFGESVLQAPDVDVDALIEELVRVDAQAKALAARVDEIKDTLKAVARARERVAGAVTLGSGEATVKCTYLRMLKVDADRAAALERRLGDRFGELFERKVTYSAVKPEVQRVLDGRDDLDPETRAAVRDAVSVTEQERLAVVRPRNGGA